MSLTCIRLNTNGFSNVWLLFGVFFFHETHSQFGLHWSSEVWGFDYYVIIFLVIWIHKQTPVVDSLLQTRSSGRGGGGVSDRCVISPPVSRKTNAPPLCLSLTHSLSPSLLLPPSISLAPSQTHIPERLCSTVHPFICLRTVHRDHDRLRLKREKLQTGRRHNFHIVPSGQSSRFSVLMEINLGTTD